MSDIPVSYTLAWLVAVWHLLIAGWIVFFAGQRTPLLTTMALVKGCLGGTVYILVRSPPWRWYNTLEWILLPIALVLMLAFSVLVTVLIWRAYQLDRPRQRLRRIVDGGPGPRRNDR